MSAACPPMMSASSRPRVTHAALMRVVSGAGGRRTVVDRQVVNGQHLMPGQTAFKIADLSSVWVDTAISEADLRCLSVGMAAAITVDGEQTRTGRIASIAPIVDEETHTASRADLARKRRSALDAGALASLDFAPMPGTLSSCPSTPCLILECGNSSLSHRAVGISFTPGQGRTTRRGGQCQFWMGPARRTRRGGRDVLLEVGERSTRHAAGARRRAG